MELLINIRTIDMSKYVIYIASNSLNFLSREAIISTLNQSFKEKAEDLSVIEVGLYCAVCLEVIAKQSIMVSKKIN